MRLLFADEVVLLASSDRDLQHALGRLAEKCEAVRLIEKKYCSITESSGISKHDVRVHVCSPG